MHPLRIGCAWVPALLTACSTSPVVATFKEMKAQACAGNVEAFFVHVDREAVKAALLRTYAERVEKEGAPRAVREPRVAAPGEEGVMGARRPAEPGEDLVEHALTGWAADVGEGRSGGVCSLSLIHDEIRGDEGLVRLRDPRGGEETWRFRRSGTEWRVVALASGP